MSDILWKCPNCSINLFVGDSAVGKTFSCPTCQVKVTAPESDFSFECPQCNKELSAPNSMSAIEFNCPACDTVFVIPSIEEESDSSSPLACPQCKKELPAGAIICINCGFNLSTGESASAELETGRKGKLTFAKQAPEVKALELSPALARFAPPEVKEPTLFEKVLPTLRIAISIVVVALIALGAWGAWDHFYVKPQKVAQKQKEDALAEKVRAAKAMQDLLKVASVPPKKTYLYPECYELAMKAVTNKNNEILGIIEKACSGDIKSAYFLGRAFMQGDDVSTNRSAALKWMQRAAEKNYPEAQDCLGVYYSLCESNQAKALQYYTMAAEGGYAPAQYKVGVYYLNSKGNEKDKEKALQWFRESAKKGYAPSQLILGMCILDGTDTNSQPREAYQWIEKAANQNYISAQLCLFDCLNAGIGTTKDPAKALQLITTIAEKGNLDAINKLIECYLGKYDYERDLSRASIWIAKALDKVKTDKGKEYFLNIKKTALAQYAKETFKDYNNSSFSNNQNLLQVANSIAHFNLKYPTVKECKALIGVCSNLLVSSVSDQVKLAVEGSKYIFEYEIEMTNKGYHRYGRNWVDANQLNQIKDRLASRDQEIEAYIRQKRAESDANVEESKRQTARENDLVQQQKARVASWIGGMRRWLPGSRRLGEDAGGDGYGGGWSGDGVTVRRATDQEYQDYMRATDGGTHSWSSGAGEFSKLGIP